MRRLQAPLLPSRIEILATIFRELDRNLSGWFGQKRRSKEIIREIIAKLDQLQKAADTREEDIKQRSSAEAGSSVEGSAGADIDKL